MGRNVGVCRRCVSVLSLGRSGEDWKGRSGVGGLSAAGVCAVGGGHWEEG